MKKSVVTLVLAAALLVSMIGMASAVSQTWYLDSDSHPAGERYMWKNDTLNCSGQVNVGLLPRTWVADKPAQCDVTFPSGTWNGQLKWEAGIALSDNVYYRIGIYNSTTNTFTIRGYNYTLLSLALSTDPVTEPFSITTDEPFTVHEGEYLAFQFKSASISIGRDIITDGDSWIKSPDSDPGYPVPEFSTLLLMSTGLLALAGYVGLRRRRNV